MSQMMLEASIKNKRISKNKITEQIRADLI